MTPTTAPTTSAFGRPDRIGRYRVLYKLGSGGMATVYLGRLEGPFSVAKLVAVKQVHPNLVVEPRFVELFVDEARIAMRLEHPNICSIIDFGDSDDGLYLVMEHLSGETLGSVIKKLHEPGQPALDWAFCARLVADAAEGLHAAHEARDERGDPLLVVHRDVSPHNIFVTYGGGVKVMDFGVAKAQGQQHATRPGDLKGKFSYMSPEQANSKEVDRRSDVWSLGVVMFELLSGRRLFRAREVLDTVLAVRTADVPLLSKVAKGLPQELDAIVARALERDLNRRYPTARELGRDLTQLLTAHGRSIGTGEIAQRMDELFQAERAERQRVLARALADVPPLSVVEAAEPDPTRVDEADQSTVKKTLAEVTEAKRPRWWIAAVALPAVLLVCGSSGFLIALATSGEGEAPVASNAEPPSAAELVAPSAQDPPRATEAAEVVARAIADAPPPEVQPEVARMDAPVAEVSERATTRVRARDRRAAVPAPEPEPEAELGAGEPGRVNVTTPGAWAEVRLRGRLIGRTPVQLELPPGRHVLSVRPFGRPPDQRVPVRVESGRLRPLVLQLRNE